MTEYAHIIGAILIILIFLVSNFLKPFKDSKNAIVISLKVVPISMLLLVLSIYIVFKILMIIFGHLTTLSITSTIILMQLVWVYCIVNSLIYFTKYRKTRKLLLSYLLTFILIFLMQLGLFKAMYSIDYYNIIEIQNEYNGTVDIDGKFSIKTRSYSSIFGREGSIKLIFQSGNIIDLGRNSINIQVYSLSDGNMYISSSMLQAINKYIIDYKNENVYYVDDNDTHIWRYKENEYFFTDENEINYDKKILKSRKHLGTVFGSTFEKIGD